MKLKLAVAALALVIATPTFAAEYYVIQSASSKKYTVASKKPTSDKMTLVGERHRLQDQERGENCPQGRRRLQGLIAGCAAAHRAARHTAPRRPCNLRTLSLDVRPLMARVPLPWSRAPL